MPITVYLHFEKSDKRRYNNETQTDIVGCDLFIPALFEVMPSVGQEINFSERDLIKLQEEINKEFYDVGYYYPVYMYEEDGIHGVSIFHDGLDEIKKAGLFNKDEWEKGNITSSISLAFSEYDLGTPYISDVMEWRKHDDGIFYPHFLVKLKTE